MEPNYALEIIHKVGDKVIFETTFNGPHDASLNVGSTTLDARLIELEKLPANPEQTRMRLTLDESPQTGKPPASFTYNYELFLQHLDSEDKLKTLHMFNGPHDARFLPVKGKLDVTLRHLATDPLDPNALRLILTLAE